MHTIYKQTKTKYQTICSTSSNPKSVKQRKISGSGEMVFGAQMFATFQISFTLNMFSLEPFQLLYYLSFTKPTLKKLINETADNLLLFTVCTCPGLVCRIDKDDMHLRNSFENWNVYRQIWAMECLVESLA